MYRVLRGVLATGAAKRRQGGCRPGEEYRMISPEIFDVERADYLAQIGRQNRANRYCEGGKASPGFVPAACNQVSASRTREVWYVLERRLVKPDKPTQGKGG